MKYRRSGYAYWHRSPDDVEAQLDRIDEFWELSVAPLTGGSFQYRAGVLKVRLQLQDISALVVRDHCRCKGSLAARFMQCAGLSASVHLWDHDACIIVVSSEISIRICKTHRRRRPGVAASVAAVFLMRQSGCDLTMFNKPAAAGRIGVV